MTKSMISNFKFQISNSRGITLVEIIAVIFIIAIFSAILISDFPKIELQFALSRATYKLSQDIRRAQDMTLSGVKTDISGNPAKGYGVYINLSDPSLGDKKYVLYADSGNQQYDAGEEIETIDFSQAESGVIIDRIEGTTNDQQVDINFKPPNPTITITSLSSGNRVQVIFALESDLSQERIVSVNTSGLIEIK